MCFYSMYTEPSGVFTRAGRRSCPHFFHLRCARSVKECSRGGCVCPICRAAFDDVAEVPSPDADPDGWFKVVPLCLNVYPSN